MRKALVLLAGGLGTRCNPSIPKQFFPIHNTPLIHYSWNALCSVISFDYCVIVCDDLYRDLCPSSPSILFAAPGLRRQDSVASGIQKLPEVDFVWIHDGARPCPPIESLFESLRTLDKASSQHPACALAAAATDTLRLQTSDRRYQTLPREHVFQMQTPQTLSYPLALQILPLLSSKNLSFTDEMAAVESIGNPIFLVPSTPGNLKVTFPHDLILCQHILPSQKNSDGK